MDGLIPSRGIEKVFRPLFRTRISSLHSLIAFSALSFFSHDGLTSTSGIPSLVFDPLPLCLVASSLATASANSLPKTSACPGTQWMDTLTPLSAKAFTILIALLAALCPGPGTSVVVLRIAAWEPAKVRYSPAVLRKSLLAITSRARTNPAISASNAVWAQQVMAGPECRPEGRCCARRILAAERDFREQKERHCRTDRKSVV